MKHCMQQLVIALYHKNIDNFLFVSVFAYFYNNRHLWSPQQNIFWRLEQFQILFIYSFSHSISEIVFVLQVLEFPKTILFCWEGLWQNMYRLSFSKNLIHNRWAFSISSKKISDSTNMQKCMLYILNFYIVKVQ